ncbi:MAG TPA: hypothetical protein V6C97_16330 [Oculatellaceae cyanobacterium]
MNRLILVALTLSYAFATVAPSTAAPSTSEKLPLVKFVNELKLDTGNQPEPQNRLCTATASEGGVSISNQKTLREFLGPNLESIAIQRVTNFETHDKFSLAKEAIEEALQKSPKTLYRYEPWANAVHADFVARLNYSRGRSGALKMTYGYICLQDENGKHWWARFTSLTDLNLTQKTGVLKFESPNGYSITDNNGHRIWLQMSEDKILVRRLDSLLSKQITVSGELMQRPERTHGNFPPGADYFANGFQMIQQ